MVNDITWHEVTESEKEEIKKKARDLLNEFSLKLEAVGGEESHFERGSGLRELGTPVEVLAEFRETTLSNAPFVEDEFVTAEKAGWNK